jgi:hypothetical protein
MVCGHIELRKEKMEHILYRAKRNDAELCNKQQNQGCAVGTQKL